jgi:energy-coupling factor transport system permease protein
VAAASTAVAAVLLGGVACPLALVAVAVLVPAAVAGVLGSLLRVALLLALPLAVSAAIVNVLFFPGGTDVLLDLGPVRATGEGLALALEVGARVLAISGAVTLLALATRPSELMADLQRRGVPPRLVFVVRATVGSVPDVARRAGTVTAAQRARGLDTEGSPWRRVRGLVPIAGPTLLGSLHDVEARTLALEARAFSRPGPRTLVWAPPDRPAERAARWAMVAGVAALAVARIGGVTLPC